MWRKMLPDMEQLCVTRISDFEIIRNIGIDELHGVLGKGKTVFHVGRLRWRVTRGGELVKLAAAVERVAFNLPTVLVMA